MSSTRANLSSAIATSMAYIPTAQRLAQSLIPRASYRPSKSPRVRVTAATIWAETAVTWFSGGSARTLRRGEIAWTGQRETRTAQEIPIWPRCSEPRWSGAGRVGHLSCWRRADNPSLGTENDFRYDSEDPDGYKCPIGSHVRRTNPRDWLNPRPGSRRSIAIGKRHRIPRRGREYGRPFTEETSGEERGLHFICINANISRQFEFIQHTWLNNPKFDELFDDTDPLSGTHTPQGGIFSIPGQPVRRRILGSSPVRNRARQRLFLPAGKTGHPVSSKLASLRTLILLAAKDRNLYACPKEVNACHQRPVGHYGLPGAAGKSVLPRHFRQSLPAAHLSDRADAGLMRAGR